MQNNLFNDNMKKLITIYHRKLNIKIFDASTCCSGREQKSDVYYFKSVLPRVEEKGFVRIEV